MYNIFKFTPSLKIKPPFPFNQFFPFLALFFEKKDSPVSAKQPLKVAIRVAKSPLFFFPISDKNSSDESSIGFCGGSDFPLRLLMQGQVDSGLQTVFPLQIKIYLTFSMEYGKTLSVGFRKGLSKKKNYDKICFISRNSCF